MATQPLVDSFDEQVRMVIERFKGSGLTLAEAVGVLAILQHERAAKGLETTKSGGCEWA